MQSGKGRQALLAVDDESGGAIGVVDAYFQTSIAQLLDANAIDEGDYDGVRQQGVLPPQIVADVPDMRSDLVALESFQVPLVRTADTFNLGELQDLLGGSGEYEYVVISGLLGSQSRVNVDCHALLSKVFFKCWW